MVFVVRRIIQSLIVVLVMSLVVFVGVHIVGDPVHILISDDMTQAELDAVIQRLGLDRTSSMSTSSATRCAATWATRSSTASRPSS